jgi:type I restriction enzyme S subunit
MNAAQVIDYFNRICDAPDAIPRLRRFILDLAVGGKLVEQDPNDEPVSELLKKIHQQKVQFGRPGRQRNNNTKIPFAATEGPFRIPSSWTWMLFGDVMISRDGERIPVSQDERNRRAKIYEYYGASGVIDQIDSYLFDKPLLLIGEDGANLINRSTPIAFIARGKYWVNNHAHVLDGISENFLRYIELYINAIDLKPYVTGTAQPKMNQAKMNSILIALPPEAEQDRIVAKIDELMALSDRLDAAQRERQSRRDKIAAASLHRLNNGADAHEFREHARFHLRHLSRLTTRPEHIQQLRQTILNLAVRGKLIPQDPKDEPASELLKRIQTEKARLAKESKPMTDTGFPPIQGDEAPFVIPSKWVWVPFGQIMISRDAERIPVSKEDRNRRAKIYDYYGASGVIDKIDNFLFDKPLLLIGEDGANLINRSTPIAFIARGKYWVNNHAHVLDAMSESFLRFIELHINAIDLKPYVTGTAQPKMNQAKMNSIPIALPPEAEQQRIIAKFDELMILCGRLEAQLNTTRTESRRLLEAVLHDAVSGSIQ